MVEVKFKVEKNCQNNLTKNCIKLSLSLCVTKMRTRTKALCGKLNMEWFPKNRNHYIFKALTCCLCKTTSKSVRLSSENPFYSSRSNRVQRWVRYN